MKWTVNEAARSSIRWIKQRAKASSRLRSLLYDDLNRDAFEVMDQQERMLADRVRVDSYATAIGRVVQPGDVVVDLGTGTGLLAMLAAHQQPRKVYAIEHGAVIEVAERVARSNGLDCIEFVRANSRDFESTEPVDVIVHEQIGTYLFEENMVENLLDLRERILRPGGRILPARFEVFLEPIAMTPEFRIPFAWEHPIHGIDYSVLATHEENASIRRDGSSSRVLTSAAALSHFACDPQPIMSIDLMSLGSVDEIPRRVVARKQVTTAGPIDGLSFYFRVVFDDELSFDTSLASPPTHWSQPVFRVPQFTVEHGASLQVMLDMGDLTDRRTWSASVDSVE